MGFAISWIGIRGPASEEVLAGFGLRLADGAATGIDAGLRTAATRDGWTIVFSNEFDPPLFDDGACQRLSASGDLVRVHLEEHVMFSAVSYWQGGVRRWQVERDGQKDPGHLEASGELPDYFAAIEREQRQQQRRADEEEEEVDYLFDIPVLLAARVTGFRHDEHDGDEFCFRGTEDVAAGAGAGAKPAKPWWRFW